jgi:hypothetical protein
MGVGRIPVFLAAAAVAGAAAGDARASLFFLLEPTAAKPGDMVTVRTGGTPKSFTLEQRIRPFQRPIRLYLVPNRLAPDVHSRFDRRAHFIGRLVPDKNGRGLLRFSVPPLESDGYAVAAWCPACAAYSRGRTFFVLDVSENIVPRYRPLMLLRVTAPPPDPCPATITTGRYGNGALWATLTPDGTIPRLGWKFGWTPTGIDIFRGLTVSGRRLDAPAPPLRVFAIRWGYSSTGVGSWASAVEFPTEGCWRITGRVGDIALSYVVKVVVAPKG